MLSAERKDNAVIVRGGLQLEIECPAEPLTQGQAPGPVDPCAKRGVDHQLHAAGFIEEALEEQPLLGRHHTRGRVLGCDISRCLLRTRLADFTDPNQPVPGSPVPFLHSRATSSSRRRATSADNSKVRPGASPRQKGIVGGAPWASLTTTSPLRTCLTRQEVLPRRKMSPALLSTA